MTEQANSSVSSRMALPLPPGRSARATSSSSSYRHTSSGSMGPPQRTSSDKQQSMTIDEMRQIHEQAVHEAEAKRTELRLVLASRYKELVGSSDEVIRMKERSEELYNLVQALPELVEKLSTNELLEEEKYEEKPQLSSEEELRIQLSELPRVIHRALYEQNIFKATTTLIELMSIIASRTRQFPLANELAGGDAATTVEEPTDPAVRLLLTMSFGQVHALPQELIRKSERILRQPAQDAESSAQALAALHLLSGDEQSETFLLDKYFEAKTNLLASLLTALSDAGEAEQVLSKICGILQNDIILHPYRIFCRGVAVGDTTMSQLMCNMNKVRSQCTQCLHVHLPVIRRKTESVLQTIAGTTASALGQIRQSLYDTTHGVESSLPDYKEAVATLVDAVRAVPISSATKGETVRLQGSLGESSFSLWGALFSHTFSSLVHSLLSTAFESVHMDAVNQLRRSLAHAPDMEHLLPHEAYRNTLLMATNLDKALLRVCDDAHELLVHAEERQESERRLGISLYVQTCEIMGRLLCELRRMVTQSSTSDDSNRNVHQLVIGRFCFFLKFRLGSLPGLLNPEHAPRDRGMISYVDLESAFDLADTTSQGSLSFLEAIEAVESAFSGTAFGGTTMVREALLLNDEGRQPHAQNGLDDTVTLQELVLLTARGLGHVDRSALGTIQEALDEIVSECLKQWSSASLLPSRMRLGRKVEEELYLQKQQSREYIQNISPPDHSVSPFVLAYLLNTSSLWANATSPSDDISPVPSSGYARSMYLTVSDDDKTMVKTFKEWMREILIDQSQKELLHAMNPLVTAVLSPVAMEQLYVDATFLQYCFGSTANEWQTMVSQLQKQSKGTNILSLRDNVPLSHAQVLELTDLLLSDFLDKAPVDGTIDVTHSQTVSLYQAPIPSTRRFVLLPIQADRSLSDLQNRKYKKEAENLPEQSSSGGVMSSAFGFLSSMRNKR